MAKKNLMSEKTTFEDLKKTYLDFKAPTVKITIDGTDIVESSDLSVGDVEVELTCLYEAGGASFNVYNAYDIKKRSFISDYMDSYFSLGKIVEIELGYIKTVHVFKGYIHLVRVSLDQENLPVISISCMDVKGSMMNNISYKSSEKKSYSEEVKEICNKSQYKQVYKTLELDDTEQLDYFVELHNQTDYQFILSAAKWYNYEFFMVSDFLYFRKPKSLTAPIMELKWRESGIISFEREISLDNITSQVEVRGYDAKTSSLITVVEKSDKTFSSSAGAKKILGDSKIIIVDSAITTKDQAGNRAKVELAKTYENFGKATVRTVGMPEIIPGRFIKLTKLGGDLDQSYYIKRVKHSFNQDGYYTTFEGGITGL